jgi:nucleoside-diphosphate-sugar epimerase
MDAPDHEFVRGDVRDAEVVERAMEGVDAVVHLAAITGARQSHEIRETVFDVNLAGTETVLDAASAGGVRKVVFASSCNVYGDTYAEDLDEAAETSPANPYAESKLEAERACEDAAVPAVSLRLATNFGYSPGVRFNLAVNSFVFRALADEPLTVYGDGSNWRPFMHVEDTARVFDAALDWEPGVYNVGWDNVRIEDVARAVEDAVDRPVERDYLADRDPGPSYHVDFSKARGEGFEATRTLSAGVRDLAERFERSRHRLEEPA